MDRSFALDAVRVTEAAALAAARTRGRGDVHASDAAAVSAMRRVFNTIHMRGTVVIGEGEADEAPMLYIGERVGRWDDEDPEIDLALDPLEGTNLCARGAPGAISVIALARGGDFLHAPDTYMKKIVVGPPGRGAIDLDRTATENLHAVADAKGVYVEDLTVVVLDRPRHESLVREIREAGARVKLISDGDVSGAIATCREETGVDMLLGVGGAPEGVITAAAIRAVGGDMQGQLKPRNNKEAERARAMGIQDLDKIYALDELASGDVLFAATGITSSDFLRGVSFGPGGAVTHSLVMRSRTGTIREIEAKHVFEGKPDYAE